MRIYKKENVYEEAKNRIRYLFDEFPEVIASISGGKDSTVILNLCFEVAREKGRLPLNVMWIDQEAEWKGTRDYVESIMTRTDVKPFWFQMPMVITNNASSTERYSYCWKEGEDWIHEKHPISLKENKYGTIRFHDLFKAIMGVEFKGKKACYIGGMRVEETPKRYLALTGSETYKGLTFGSCLDKKQQHYSFHPIYDWSYKDVWKYINDNKLCYNRIYDEMYKKGVKIQDMRISNVHHETSIQTLLLIQEIEPETWNKVAKRIGGANTIKHLKNQSFRCPRQLPYMFKDWEEYATFLCEKLVLDEKNRNKLKEVINKNKDVFVDEEINRSFYREVINTILSNDWDYTKITNFLLRPETKVYVKFKKGKRKRDMIKYAKYLKKEELEELWKSKN